jgi:hypothetical protein
MTVSTREWTPLDEFELEFEEVLPASLAVARARLASIESANRCFTGDLLLRVVCDGATPGLNGR